MTLSHKTDAGNNKISDTNKLKKNIKEYKTTFLITLTLKFIVLLNLKTDSISEQMPRPQQKHTITDYLNG